MKNKTRNSETRRYSLDFTGLLQLINYLKFLRSIAAELPGGMTEIFGGNIMHRCEMFTGFVQKIMNNEPDASIQRTVSYGAELEDDLEFMLDCFFLKALADFMAIDGKKYGGHHVKVSGAFALFTLDVNKYETSYDKLLESYNVTQEVVVAAIAETERLAQAVLSRETAQRRAAEAKKFQEGRSQLERAMASF